ncbi:MAG: GGDEF and EAL domain-containing protein [Deltaproteobacteria bacterium]|nr:GGDEF and EAL domain-containing protein [Deltaproteobacteria bacterium]
MTHKLDTIDRSALAEVAGRWLEALTLGSTEAVALFDVQGALRFLGSNEAVREIIGYDVTALRGRDPLSLVHPSDRDRLQAAFGEIRAAQPGARLTVEYRVMHQRGQYARVRSTATHRLTDPVVGSIVVFTHLAQPAGLAEGEPDPASQVQNRSIFTEAVQKAVDRTRSDETYGFSVLVLELARLKMLIGSYGQEVVDQLFGEVSKRLIALLRPEDSLAQFGGGEFAILLDGVCAKRQAAKISDRIQKTVEMRYTVGEHEITTAAIVGIATSERTYEQAEHVMRDAALAANRARRLTRKRRAVFQTQMRVEDTRFMSTVSALHGALQGNQFILHYQPIVELGTRGLVGFEALLRWLRPDEGIIPPDQFIPIAEETGLIVQIGEWVLHEATRQMAHWNRTLCVGEPLHVSVNLSAKQLAEEDLTRQVEAALTESGLGAENLKLEVTETAVLENRDVAAQAIGKLKEQGVRISLDDFGTGYSSFSYLYQLPYDTLKIDRSFVSRIGETGQSTEIVHAIIVLAHNLRMDVVAEGVETAAQAAQLNTMWCEFAQGYYFAKPVDAEAATALIAARLE